MAGNGQRLLDRVAGQIDDVHGAVGLIGGVGAAAVGERGNAGGIVSDRNGKRGAECLAVVAVFIEADVDEADSAAIVVGDDELLRGRDVFGVDRAGDGGRIRAGEAGRGGKRQAGMAGDQSGRSGW